MWDGGPPRSAAGRTTVFPLRVLQVNHSCDYCYPGLTQSITHRLTWTSCADTHHLWAGNNTTRRLCKDICAFCKTQNDGDEVVPFSLALSLQKWKPKGTALQHMVSGLCLDSQTPTGPLVITQCRPQVASQSWEPQIITWATADGGGTREREEERGAGSGPGLQKDSGGGGGEGDHICTLSDASPRGGRSENCTSVMSTSSSPAHRVSVTRAFAENVTRPHRGLSVYSASSLSRMLQFFYVI